MHLRQGSTQQEGNGPLRWQVHSRTRRMTAQARYCSAVLDRTLQQRALGAGHSNAHQGYGKDARDLQFPLERTLYNYKCLPRRLPSARIWESKHRQRAQCIETLQDGCKSACATPSRVRKPPETLVSSCKKPVRIHNEGRVCSPSSLPCLRISNLRRTGCLSKTRT